MLPFAADVLLGPPDPPCSTPASEFSTSNDVTLKVLVSGDSLFVALTIPSLSV